MHMLVVRVVSSAQVGSEISQECTSWHFYVKFVCGDEKVRLDLPVDCRLPGWREEGPRYFLFIIKF